MNLHSSQLLAIAAVAVLGAALFVTRGGSGHSHGMLASVSDVSVASAASMDSSSSANVAGDKAWEVVGGPIKVSNVKAATEAQVATAAASAPMGRLPW